MENTLEQSLEEPGIEDMCPLIAEDIKDIYREGSELDYINEIMWGENDPDDRNFPDSYYGD